MSLSRRQESQIKALYTRHGRKKSNLCVCEGIRCCSEVFAEAPQLVKMVIASAATAGEIHVPQHCELAIINESEFDRLGSTVNSQGVIALVERPAEAAGELSAPFILVLDQLGDPGNVGTILRTALAAGLPEVWYTAGSVDPFAEKTIRAALGAQFRLKLRSFRDFEELRNAAARQNYNKVFLSDPHRGVSCFECKELFERSLVVIGSEANGIESNLAGERVTIPMPGNFESLNAAQAATIFIFEFVRRTLA